MASFRQARDELLLSFSDGIIDEEEFLLLYDINQSKNPEYPYWNYERFMLQDKNEAECKTDFRFEKHDIPLLVDVLGLPGKITCKQGTICDSTEGLCIVLKRLAYPCRYSDLINIFGRPVPEISMISNTVMDFIFEHHGHRISVWNQTILNPHALETYAEAISDKGAALGHCFGFVDGTVRPICRPNTNQRIVYNGHKRVHALKFQSVAIPNGLIANLYGPVEGRSHDAGMLRDSGLYHDLQRFAFSPTGLPFCLYGDPAYPLRLHLQAPFRNGIVTPQMQQFNTSMSRVRTSVEWLFGDIINYFCFLDFKKNLKIGLSQIGKMYIVCALLRNALTCLYGNFTSKYFDLEPPSLEEYFA